jgi:hypothetical protein
MYGGATNEFPVFFSSFCRRLCHRRKKRKMVSASKCAVVAIFVMIQWILSRYCLLIKSTMIHTNTLSTYILFKTITGKFEGFCRFVLTTRPQSNTTSLQLGDPIWLWCTTGIGTAHCGRFELCRWRSASMGELVGIDGKK